MRNRYDMQLHLLDTQLTHMGELCETAIAKVTQALKEGNTEQAKIVIKEDEEIDQIEKDIERLCLKLLLQQQPVARDLKIIINLIIIIHDCTCKLQIFLNICCYTVANHLAYACCHRCQLVKILIHLLPL